MRFRKGKEEYEFQIIGDYLSGLVPVSEKEGEGVSVRNYVDCYRLVVREDFITES